MDIEARNLEALASYDNLSDDDYDGPANPDDAREGDDDYYGEAAQKAIDMTTHAYRNVTINKPARDHLAVAAQFYTQLASAASEQGAPNDEVHEVALRATALQIVVDLWDASEQTEVMFP